MSSPQLSIRYLNFKNCDLLACKQTKSKRWMCWIAMKDISIKKCHDSALFILDLHLLMTSYISIFATQIKYKEDLQMLKGLGCFLMDTPDMVRSRHLRKLWVSVLLHNTWLLWHSFRGLGRTNHCLELLLRGNLPLTLLTKSWPT